MGSWFPQEKKSQEKFYWELIFLYGFRAQGIEK